MAHVALVSIPFHGHVNPSLEIVRELVRRGHRVTYANDPSFAKVITATGAELKPYASTLPPAGTHDDLDPIAQLTMFLDDAIAMLPQLREAYDDDRPDLFLYDIAGAPARLLGEQWGIPSVQLSPTYVPGTATSGRWRPWSRRCGPTRAAPTTTTASPGG